MKGKLSIIVAIAIFMAVGLFMVTARPASAKDLFIDLSGGTAVVTYTKVTAENIGYAWVGQQIEVRAVNPTVWAGNAEIKATWGGAPLLITDDGDNPVTMVTGPSAPAAGGSLATGRYFIRVPHGIRDGVEITFTGPEFLVAGGQGTPKSVNTLLTMGAGINVTKSTSPLPDWSTGGQKVGKKLKIYGSGWKRTGSDSGIVVLWDGQVVLSGMTASNGRWESEFVVPEAVGEFLSGVNHIVEAYSINQPLDFTKPLPTIATANIGKKLPEIAGARGYTGAESRKIGNVFLAVAPTSFRVKPDFTLKPTSARPGDMVSIEGKGWGGSTGVLDNIINVNIRVGARVFSATTSPVTVKTSSNGTFSGAFKVPELTLGLGGPVNVEVSESKEPYPGVPRSTVVNPMTISRSLDIVLSPSSGLGSVTVEGSGFNEGSAVNLLWEDKPVPAMSRGGTIVTAEGTQGTFTAIISVPETKPGTYTIKAEDTSAEKRSASAKFTVPSLALPDIALKPGPTGPAGPIGPEGPAGPAGKAGKAGPAGEAGPAGRAGSAGSAGPAGPAGPAGEAGPAGKAGTAGTAGTAGKDAPVAVVIIALLISIVAIIISLVAIVRKPAAPKA